MMSRAKLVFWPELLVFEAPGDVERSTTFHRYKTKPEHVVFQSSHGMIPGNLANRVWNPRMLSNTSEKRIPVTHPA